MRWRAMTEEHARDSFENLLFSLCRFRQLHGPASGSVAVVDALSGIDGYGSAYACMCMCLCAVFPRRRTHIGDHCTLHRSGITTIAIVIIIIIVVVVVIIVVIIATHRSSRCSRLPTEAYGSLITIQT